MSKPSWDECRVAKMTAQDAAAARGVEVGTALRKASRWGFSWAKHNPLQDALARERQRVELATAGRDHAGAKQ